MLTGKLAGDTQSICCWFLCLGDTPAVSSSGPALRVKFLGVKCIVSFDNKGVHDHTANV